MKKFISKAALACTVAAVSVLSAPLAQAADLFPDFTIKHTEGTNPTRTFVADKITGNYVEVITFDGFGGFEVSLEWSAGQFSRNQGEDPVLTSESGLGVDYGLYATYRAKGTVGTDSSGRVTFTFTPGTGAFNVFLDENADTSILTKPADGSLPFTFLNDGDDIPVASGVPLAGGGTLNPPGCGFQIGINCGSFGSTTSFALTSPAGPGFFFAPDPFYDLSFQSGQLNNFLLIDTQRINGSLDVVFGRVPEPATTALFGLGLLGLGFTGRRRKQK